MMTRERCEKIAKDWFAERAGEEYERRMKSITKRKLFPTLVDDKVEMRVVPRDFEQDAKLRTMCTEAFVRRLYDPPMPRIPGLLTRLCISEWTPPEPTAEQWPMNTASSRREELPS